VSGGRGEKILEEEWRVLIKIKGERNRNNNYYYLTY